jgi:Flp pilus assembly protein TadG
MRLFKGENGNSIIEFCLVLPWFVLLFTGVLDFGFYTVGLIGVQNATRVAALHASANSTTAADQSGACALAIEELRALPNIGSSFSSSCSAAPITLSTAYCDGSTACSGSATSVDGGPAAYVTVAYQLPSLFRVPLGGTTVITRSAEVRLRDLQQ